MINDFFGLFLSQNLCAIVLLCCLGCKQQQIWATSFDASAVKAAVLKSDSLSSAKDIYELALKLNKPIE